VLAVISLIVTHTNLGWSKSFIGDDIGVTYYYLKEALDLSFYMWNSYNFPGYANTIGTIALPFIGFLALLNKIGLTPVLISRVIYFLFFFVSSASFYVFALGLLGDTLSKRKAQSAAVVGSIFYILNYLVMVLTSWPLSNYHLTYALLPLLFHYSLKALNSKSSLKEIIIFSLLTFLVVGGNPANTLVLAGLLLIYNLVFGNNTIKNIKKYAFALFLITLLICYILFPVLKGGGSPYAAANFVSNLDSIQFSSAHSSFLNLFRFAGFHSWSVFPYYSLLTKSPFFIFLGFSIPIFVIFSFYFFEGNRKYKKQEIFFLGTFLSFLLIAKGAHAPFGNWFINLFSIFEFLGMFRATYYKFGMYVCFSAATLLVFGYHRLLVSDKKRVISILTWLVPLFILANAYPLLAGKAVMKKYLTEVPEGYAQVRSYFESNSDNFNVLTLPQISSSASYAWVDGDQYGGYGLPDSLVFNKSIWAKGTAHKAFKNVFDGFPNDVSLEDTLRSTSTAYIVLHKDIPESYRLYEDVYVPLNGQVAYMAIAEFLEANPNFILDLSTDVLDVYVDKNREAVFPKVFLNNYETGFDTVSYERLNPTKYSVKLSDVNGNVSLVLNEGFHPKWKLYPNISSKKAVTQLNRGHFEINNFANGWNISVDELCKIPDVCTSNSDGTFEVSLDIEFAPQRYFRVGLLISLATLFSCLILLTIKSQKK